MRPADAYAKTARIVQSPRDLEASLLGKAAFRLQSVRDHFDPESPALEEALNYNRNLWAILSTSAVEIDNPLPKEIKENIANLAIFIFNRTLEIMLQPSADKLDALIKINREISAGLAARAS